jgi:hypothetical protein
MKKLLLLISIIGAFGVGIAFGRTQMSIADAAAASAIPSSGWTLHIDAQMHFAQHPAEIAHHYCKPVAAGMTECQIYSSDASNAPLVAVETIVQPNVYRSFSPSERALWHWHKVEIPRVHATLPGMSRQQAAKVVASITNTYGKVWLLYDPLSTNGLPTGRPTITVLK